MFAEKSQLYDSNSGEISSGTDPTFDGFCGTLLVSDPSKRPGIAWLLAPILALGCLGFSMVRMRQRAPWFALNIQKTMENHHFTWENSLFLWPFSIAMLVCQRVNEVKSYAIFGGLNPTGQSLLVTF
jgi:hypothetical protein